MEQDERGSSRRTWRRMLELAIQPGSEKDSHSSVRSVARGTRNFSTFRCFNNLKKRDLRIDAKSDENFLIATAKLKCT